MPGIDIGREMSLPMEQIIGGPLQAIVKAQALAASTTADFIQTVGLQPSTTGGATTYTARTVDFSFTRKTPNASGGAVVTENVNLSVPLLTILPVPFIRVEEATIDFEANVASSTLDTTESKFGISASASGGFFGARFSVNATYSRASTHKNEVTKSATLNVHVKAVQDKIPAGLETVLQILQTAISETKQATGTPP